MYRPPAFAENDFDVLAAILAETRLATLVTTIDGRLVADHVPMLFDGSAGPLGTLVGHLARANPQAAPQAEGREVLVIVGGPEAYVSPGFYPSKQEHGRVVPTWNYVAVHARGRLRRIETGEPLRAILAALTDRHEAGRAEPWSIADAPGDHLAAQLKGIVGFAIEIASLEGKRKLSQNRDAADRAGVVAGLAASDDPRDRAVAAVMRADGGRRREDGDR